MKKNSSIILVKRIICLPIIALIMAYGMTGCIFPPEVVITSPAEGSLLNSSTITVTGTVRDPFPSSGIASVIVNGISASLDRGKFLHFRRWSFTAVLTDQPEGPLTIIATAEDIAGNISEPDSVSVFIDTVPPSIEITSPVSGEIFNTSTIVVIGTITDPFPGSGIAKVLVNGTEAEIINGSFTKALFDVDDGLFVIEAIAEDAAGNINSDLVQILIAIIMNITITSPPDGCTPGSPGCPYVTCNVTGTADFSGQPYVISTVPLEASITIRGVTADPASLLVTVTGPTPVPSRIQSTDQFAITYYGVVISSGTAGETPSEPDSDSYTNHLIDNTTTFAGVKPGDQLTVAGETVIVLGVSGNNDLFITTNVLAEGLTGQSWSIREENTTGGATGRISGYVEVPLPVFCNSDGLAEDVVIYAELDDDNPGTPPGTYTSIITLQLAHFGVDPVTVITTLDATAIVNICAWVDPCAVSIEYPTETAVCITAPTCGGLGGYDFDLTFNDPVGVVTFVAANSPTGPFAAVEFLAPTGLPFPLTPVGTLRINSAVDTASYDEGPTGFMKLAEIVFERIGGIGSTTPLLISQDDILRNPPGNPLYPWSFVEFWLPINPPYPQDRKQDGVIIISPPPPPPSISDVCDAGEPGDCWMIDGCANIPTGGFFPITITGSDFDCSNINIAVVCDGMFETAVVDMPSLVCTSTQLDVDVGSGGCTTGDVTVTNDNTGLSDTAVDSLCVP